MTANWFSSKLKSGMTTRAAIAVALIAALTFLLPQGMILDYEYQIGSIWTYEDVIAPFPFPVYRDPVVYENEKNEAIRNTIRSFDRIDSISIIVGRKVTSVFSYITAICREEQTVRTDPARAPEAASVGDSLRRKYIGDLPPFPLEGFEWSILTNMTGSAEETGDDPLQRFLNRIKEAVEKILQFGYLDQSKSSFTRPTLALLEGRQEIIKPIADFLDAEEVPDRLRKDFRSLYPAADSLTSLAVKISVYLLQPNIVLNRERTDIALDWNVDRVPRTSELIKENERIVSKHDRITPEIKLKLDSYRRAQEERGGDVNLLLVTAGKAGHVVVILFLLALYLYQFRKKIFYDNSRLLSIAILIAFEGLLAYLTFTLSVSAPIKYLVLVPIASMLLGIMFDSRMALTSTVVIALLVGAIRGNDYSIAFTSLAAGAVSIYTVRDIKHRTQIFRSFVFIFITYLIAIVALGLQRYEGTELMFEEIGFAFGNALISPVLTYGFLAFFERVFGITTDLTLLELSDFNHPLLRELSAKAPGTFHHSVVMGTLAEAAAKSIDANPILARVGAYYHDIGKIAEPSFFVENQLGAENVHEQLAPAESTKYIINHVIRGIELGRAYKLPDQIIDFIPAHHGRNVITFFYEKEKLDNPDASSEDFRYPGPNPVTKETGIVMLADAIEAAARAIEEPTIEKIETLIDTMVTERINSGYLDECQLTLKDIRDIKKSFLGILTGIHHSRIRYPSNEEKEAARKHAERTSHLLRLPSTIDAIARRMKQIDTK